MCRRQREKAWSVWPYPCIGQWRFLQLAIGQHALYRSEILPRMLTGEQIYLDLGCAFAQDIRRLVADGVDSRQCYGSDLRLEFLDLGYELFGDKQTLKSRFIDADIFDTNSDLRDLQGRIDIVDASSFFHLFSLEQQKTIARRVSTLLRPQKDSLVVGRQVGSEEPGEYPRRDGQGSRYRHDLASWRQLWAEVGAELGVRYEVNGILKAVEGITDRPHTGEFGRKMMEFSVRRLG